jgi:AcrR family transcriptional regulator
MAMRGSLERRAEIGRERRERTRGKLIAAAARVIAARGEDNARIDDFITEAGVARGTFYNYFLTREELIEAVWTYVGKTPFEHILALSETLDDPAARITANLRLVAERAAADETWGWLIYSLSGQREVNEDLRVYPSADLRTGIETGRFGIATIEVARDVIVAVARTVLRQTLDHKADAAYASEACRMLLLMLGIAEREAGRIATAPLPVAG